MTQSIRLLLILLVLFLAACQPAGPQAGSKTETALPLTDCTLKMPGESQMRAQCGTLPVPEDPDNPDGRKIELNVAVIRAVSRSPAPDPIFLLAGGPGQAATEAFLMLLPSADRLHFKRDLVMVDQRGTGKSNPLTCPDETQSAGQPTGVEHSREEQLAELERCRANLDADPQLYTTAVAMNDLDQVRAALGYDQINLLGVSYGTRAALTYAALYPERTRSLILDGVVPPDWVLGGSAGADAQRALDLLFDRCAKDAACQARYPGLVDEFRAVMERVSREKVDVSVTHPRTGEPVKVQMNQSSVSFAVRMMTYNDTVAALLPMMIHAAAQGDYQGLASEYLILSQDLTESINTGMYYAVVCNEDEPSLPASSAEGSYFDPQLELVHEACQRWLNGKAPEVAEPGKLDTQTPTLLISGEADPVTPPANGELVARTLPNSLHLVLPGHGHSNFYVSCMPDVVLQFLDNATPAGDWKSKVNLGCAANFDAQPFFLGPLGPKP